MAEIVDSFNLFVDSRTGLSGRGDDVMIQVGNAGIHAADGQMIRVSLESFNMYRNFYTIHGNNALFRVSAVNAAATTDFRTGELAHQNIKTIGEGVALFATALSTTLLATATALGSTATTCTSTYTPATTVLMDDAGTRQMTITFTFNADSKITGLNVNAFEQDGDLYNLFGANRITGTPAYNITNPSFNITITDSTHITIKSYYACQRSTDAHLYLRCDLPNNGLETSSLTAGSTTSSGHVVNSDILARIPIDYELCHFAANTGEEFFLNLNNRNLSQMRFYIRDEKDRPFGRRSGYTQSDFVGAGTQQNTLGNLHFTMVLKFSIIQKYQPKYLNVPPPQETLPARREGNVLQNF